MTRLNNCALVLVLLLSTRLAACVNATWADYPVKDSRRQAPDSASFYWVDDRHLLFEAFNGQNVVRPDGYKVQLKSLYFWSIETGKIEDEGPIAGGLCYADGYIRYWKWKKDASGSDFGDLMAGKLGSQVEVNHDPLDVRIDANTCRPYVETPLPEWTRGKSVLRLKPGRGFLLLGPEKDDTNSLVTYHPTGGPDGIEMPFKRRQFHLSNITYSPVRDAYFIQGLYFFSDPRHPAGGYNKVPWPEGAPVTAWWLYANGKVEEVRLPAQTRVGDWIFPAGSAIFYVSHRYPGSDGLFKVLGRTSVEPVMKGFIEKYAVSPDACHIAVNHDPHFTGKHGQGSIKVIDVCNRGG
jgi:hypothetical protein